MHGVSRPRQARYCLLRRVAARSLHHQLQARPRACRCLIGDGDLTQGASVCVSHHIRQTRSTSHAHQQVTVAKKKKKKKSQLAVVCGVGETAMVRGTFGHRPCTHERFYPVSFPASLCPFQKRNRDKVGLEPLSFYGKHFDFDKSVTQTQAGRQADTDR